MGGSDILKSIQFYRKVHSDFTDATSTTGVISIGAAVVMTFLFFSQLSEFLTIHEETTMVMDENTVDKLRINFNVTMQFLPCRFASIDVADSHGDHYVNITTHVAKWRIITNEDDEHERLAAKPTIDRRIDDRSEKDIETATPTPNPEELDVYSENEDNAKDITPDNFEQLVSTHDLTLINFYAPWCHWSNRLKPVWEHTASFYKDNPRVLLGRVDCTNDANRDLCRKNHIMAFPTIRIYRLGSTDSHEFYDGDRQTHSLLEYISGELKEMKGTVVRSEGDSEDPAPPIHLRKGDRRFKNLGEEQYESTSRGPEGCMLTGFVMVNRAPGNFHIRARAVGSSFDSDSLNTTHLVTSLTFGSPLSIREIKTLNDDISPFINTLENEYFPSTHYGVTREHYVKVVHTQYKKLGARSPVSTYQYTNTDTEYVEHPPSAKFSFDLSPLQVVVTQSRQPLTTFVTSVCAIIGGVFTVIGLVDSVLYHSLNVLKKKNMGKLG